MTDLFGLNAYRVGGYVRDVLMDREPRDCDWVVVGHTAADLRARGFRQVGRDFPVFLHPDTAEEFALARTRRRSAASSDEAVFDSNAGVTLDQDLSRRDFTINAIAMDSAGRLSDPFGGRGDIEAGIIRHVGEAFSDDPVRILRGARFAAAFDFTIAPETYRLMQRLVSHGAVDILVPERVWAELLKALMIPKPSRFFVLLQEVGALRKLLPELAALSGVPQPIEHHPEIDAFEHVMLSVDQAASLSPDPMIRFAVLLHDLGKGLTPAAKWPSHHGHERAGIALVKSVCQRLTAPTDYIALANAVCEHHLKAHSALALQPKTIVGMLESIDGFRRPERVDAFVIACEADARGRQGTADRPYPQAEYLRACFAAASRVSARDIVAAGVQGPQVGVMLRAARVKAVRRVKHSWQN